MIVLRNNNSSHLEEKIFRGEVKYVKRYLPDVGADTIGKGEIYAQGITKGVKNNVLVPLQKLGIKVKGKAKGKTKDQVRREIVAYDAKRARKGSMRGWQKEHLLENVHTVNEHTSSQTRKARVPYPDDLTVRAKKSAISDLADSTGGIEEGMKKAVKRSKERMRRKADQEARRMVTSLEPQFC